MFILTFQASILFLIILSFLMIIGVPVIFASPNGWNENKNYIILSSAIWTGLVLIVGILNSFIA
jgi:photosystem II PsbZ protein